MRTAVPTLSLSARDAGVGDHLVYDLASGTLKQFKVDCPGIAFDRVGSDEARAAADVAALHRAEIEQASEITASCKQPLVLSNVPVEPVAQKAFDSGRLSMQRQETRRR